MSRKGENIFYRADGRWEARYVKEQLSNGKVKYGYIYGKSYLDVKNKRKEILLNLEEEKKQKKINKHIFQYYIDNWLISMKYMVKNSTYAHYYRLVNNHISPFLGDIKIKYLDSEVIEKFINEKYSDGRVDGGGGLSSKSIRDIIVILRQILTYAEIYIPFKLPKIKNKQIHIFNKLECKKLENTVLEMNTTYAVGILISLYTGLRLGELCALKWGDIDLKKKVISVNKTIERICEVEDSYKKTKIIIDNPKSESSKRKIPINKYLLNILKKFYQNDKEKYFLTGDKKYSEPRTYYNRYKHILFIAGLPSYGFHTLRHTFATRCIEVGMDPKTLSEILGHADIKITLSLYVHPNASLKNKYIEKLSPNIN